MMVEAVMVKAMVVKAVMIEAVIKARNQSKTERLNRIHKLYYILF